MAPDGTQRHSIAGFTRATCVSHHGGTRHFLSQYTFLGLSTLFSDIHSSGGTLTASSPNLTHGEHSCRTPTLTGAALLRPTGCGTADPSPSYSLTPDGLTLAELLWFSVCAIFLPLSLSLPLLFVCLSLLSTLFCRPPTPLGPASLAGTGPGKRTLAVSRAALPH